MSRFERGEVVTCYFVIMNENNNRRIQAWSYDKDLVKMYMKFHKTKNFSLKSITKTVEKIGEITEENIHDEIKIGNMLIRDPKHPDRIKTVSAPVTSSEIMLINAEIGTLLASRIQYSYLNDVFPYLKKKYQIALHKVFLEDAINKVINNRSPKIFNKIRFDQLAILFKSFPTMFGK